MRPSTRRNLRLIEHKRRARQLNAIALPRLEIATVCDPHSAAIDQHLQEQDEAWDRDCRQKECERLDLLNRLHYYWHPELYLPTQPQETIP